MNQLLAIRAFMRVAESGSFHRAAVQMGIPRSTLSKLISDLEHHLGSQLINRTTRTVSVTREGMEYLSHAEKVIFAVESADSAIRHIRQKPGGPLRVETPASFAQRLLIPALPEFHALYPDITVSLGINDRMINIVGDGADCAIRAGYLQDMNMIGRKLFTLEYVTCASVAYISEFGVPETPDDLERQHRIVNYFSAVTAKPDPLIFMASGVTREISLSHFAANEGEGNINMLLAGLGVGQHLRLFVQRYLDEGILVPLLSGWSRPSLPFHILYPPNRHQNARLEAFVNWVINRFAQ